MHKIFDNKIILSLTHKLSFIFVALYIVGFNLSFSVSEHILYMFLSFLLAFGIGGIGYLINDFTDLKLDTIANKRNLFLMFKKRAILIIAFFCIVCSIWPWLVFPFTKMSILLLFAEIGLFVLYSCQPFRLKERGVWGLIADSFYAHLIPFVFAFYTYSMIKLPQFAVEPYHIIGIIWVFIVGFRNILNHQIEDLDNDKKSNTITFIQNFDLNTIKLNIVRFLIPLEILSFILAFTFSSSLKILLVVIFTGYSFLYFMKRKKEIIEDNSINLNGLYKFLNDRILNEYYERWMGLLLLILSLFFTQNIGFLAVIAIHLLVFNRIIFTK